MNEKDKRELEKINQERDAAFKKAMEGIKAFNKEAKDLNDLLK